MSYYIPGWYEDPQRPGRECYWDGVSWTQQRYTEKKPQSKSRTYYLKRGAPLLAPLLVLVLVLIFSVSRRTQKSGIRDSVSNNLSYQQVDITFAKKAYWGTVSFHQNGGVFYGKKDQSGVLRGCTTATAKQSKELSNLTAAFLKKHHGIHGQLKFEDNIALKQIPQSQVIVRSRKAKPLQFISVIGRSNIDGEESIVALLEFAKKIVLTSDYSKRSLPDGNSC